MSLKFYFSIITVFSIGVPLCASQTIQELEQTTHASQVADKRRINPKLNQKLLNAVSVYDTEKVEELLSAEEIPDVNANDKYGDTALMLAAQNGETAIVQSLIDAGADVNAKNNKGDTVLMLAAEAQENEDFDQNGDGQIVIVQALIGAGANVNAKNNKGVTALMQAAPNDNTAIVQALIGAGANVNAKDNDGTTALMQAVQNGRAANVKTLLEAKANPMLKNKNNETALMRAEKAMRWRLQNAELREIEKMLQDAENVWKRAAIKQRQQVQKISELPGLAPDMEENISQYAYPKLSPSEITGKM